ncbi:MAG: Lectin, partial [Verrucomicrobiales bacterium]|nr:Lectin [Verrucomicrobiales bacterium]
IVSTSFEPENHRLTQKLPDTSRLTDVAKPGTFQWMDGEPVSYERWAAGEPNAIGQEHFVGMFPPNRLDPVSQPAGYWNNFLDQDTEWHGGSPIHEVLKLRSSPRTVSSTMKPARASIQFDSSRLLSLVALGSLQLDWLLEPFWFWPFGSGVDLLVRIGGIRALTFPRTSDG